MIELCRDRACSTVIETVRVVGSSARPSVALPPSSTVFWRARARVGAVDDRPSEVGPTWLFHTPVRDNTSAIDSSSTPHADFNGDGFDDIAVGSPGRVIGGMWVGSVSVFHGSRTGLGASANLVVDGGIANDSFGRHLATTGDVNGDGYSDLAVASARNSWIFYGGASGLRSPAAVELGEAVVSTAGDVNADGFADVLHESTASGLRVLFGSAAGIATAAGQTISFPPHVLGRRFFNSDLGPNVTGDSSAHAGDVDGDGFGDIVTRVARPASTAYYVLVFHGTIHGIATHPQIIDPPIGNYLYWGAVVAGGGDLNGDGLSDLLVSATVNYACVMAYFGAPIRITSEGSGTPSCSASSSASSIPRLGSGDLNGDGYSEAIVSLMDTHVNSPSLLYRAGTVIAFPGAAAPNWRTPLWQAFGSTTAALFGAAISGGDVNGDGFGDLVVGVPTFPDPTSLTPGSVSVFHGSASGLGPAPSRVLTGAPLELFGVSIAGTR
ncbi:MAG: FG-GAP and VCBS repeat-containing protein [Polyangiales bacterium]